MYLFVSVADKSANIQQIKQDDLRVMHRQIVLQYLQLH